MNKGRSDSSPLQLMNEQSEQPIRVGIVPDLSLLFKVHMQPRNTVIGAPCIRSIRRAEMYI